MNDLVAKNLQPFKETIEENDCITISQCFFKSNRSFAWPNENGSSHRYPPNLGRRGWICPKCAHATSDSWEKGGGVFSGLRASREHRP